MTNYRDLAQRTIGNLRKLGSDGFGGERLSMCLLSVACDLERFLIAESEQSVRPKHRDKRPRDIVSDITGDVVAFDRSRSKKVG